MTFTPADFLISILITVIIVFTVIFWRRKKIDTSANPFGCIVSCFIMFFLILCAVGGCSRKIRNNVQITLVSTGRVVEIPKSELVGKDTIYLNRRFVYKNDTGRDLVMYSVKYTKNGYDSDGNVYGNIIRPNQFFIWYDDDRSYHMFEQPPSSTTLVRRGRSVRDNQLDFTYLHFLDYADNIPSYVIVNP